MAATASTKAIEDAVLDVLKPSADACIADSGVYAAENGVDHLVLVGVLKSLEAEAFVSLKSKTTPTLTLTADGSRYVATGTPERRVFDAVPEGDGIARSELQAALGKDFGPGWSQCMKKRCLGMDKATQVVTRRGELTDDLAPLLKAVQDGSALSKADQKALKKRKMVATGSRTTWQVSRGEAYKPRRARLATTLTKEMLDSGAWKTAKFKTYKLAARARRLPGGHLHPLLKVRTEFRSMLLEMGFEEMPTAQFVESSFWNFDALFQPQSHPARDAHDTFFLVKPEKTLRLPEDYVARVKDIHENGGHGSIGYGCKWKRSEADKNILRTHTTAVSAQMLYRVAQQETFKPIRLFSIDRVFRNETMDATHLAEFHQVEGVVADYDLSLGDLIGLITEFFRRMGITELRFKPAYNPYTEPSMEIFGYHPQLKKWTELGNSGIFRPEMLRPMGLPASVRVIAWGISLERPTMIRYNIDNIRTLFGHRVKVSKTRASPLTRFDAGAAGKHDGATRADGSGRPYRL